MVQAVLKVKVDLRGIKALKKALASDLRGSGSAPIRSGLQAATTILENYLKRRHLSGAGWEKLAESTSDKKGHRRILWEEAPKRGSLYKSITSEMTSKGFFTGYLKSQQHVSGRVTVERLAEIHTKGLGINLPSRRVLPETVPKTTIEKMIDRIRKGYIRVATRSS